MGMYAGDYSHLDAGDIGRAVMEWYALSLEQGLSQRARLPAGTVCGLLPARVCRSAYGSGGKSLSRLSILPLSEESRTAMQAHIDANPKGKHGKHEYDLSEYGLTRELIEQRFAFISR